MPKRRMLKFLLAGVSCAALGAGIQAGWSNLNSRPGGAWGTTAKAWTTLVNSSASPASGGRKPAENIAVAAIPASKASPSAALSSAANREPGTSQPSARVPNNESLFSATAPPAEAPPPVALSVPASREAPGNALAAIGRAIIPPAVQSPVGTQMAARGDPAAKPALPPQPDLEPSTMASYAPLPETQNTSERLQGKAPPMPIDITGMKDALIAYKAGSLEKGDAAAKTATDETARLALEWATLRLLPREAGFNRIEAFLTKNPQWPTAGWLRARAEQAMYVDNIPAAKISRWFEANQPVSPSGQMILARRLLAAGKVAEATTIVSRIWRQEDLSTWAEGAIQKDFSDVLTAADHRWRSDRYFYKEKYPASLAAAAKAGKDYAAFANARVLVARGADPAKAGEKIDAKLRQDPTWHFARITNLRKGQKYEEAATLLLAAPSDPDKIIEANEWWEERRIVARKRLDSGDAEGAYRLVANHGAVTGETYISAEFHAGWIALRFLDKPDTALTHFTSAADAANTPMSRSRAFYWQARAAERGEDPGDADRLYALAAQYSSSYYGQLAMARLGRKDIPIRTAPQVAEGQQRLPAIRVVEVLEALGEADLSMALAAGMGRMLEEPSQLAALAAVLNNSKNARATVVAGKLASQRGLELDDIAFPVFGIPEFATLPNSAAKPVVYAIARQESMFQANVTSHAGAKGLMQMLTSTAARTAKNKKVPFDANRLLSDPAFNAQLGAAHLGELMDEHPGSLMMVFAAYNAGGHRVKQWIAAYGDPRKPGVDPIDWVERIPFTETRNYVQRVAENLAVYRALLKEDAVPQMAERELRAYAARM